jgi:hypothetical protein
MFAGSTKKRGHAVCDFLFGLALFVGQRSMIRVME